jgi:predicted metal-binding protein
MGSGISTLSKKNVSETTIPCDKTTTTLASPPGLETKEEERQHIRRYVKNLLKNDKTNNSYVPDFIEERVYQQLLESIVSNLKKALTDTKIEILDHEIRFIIVPKES